MVTIRRESRNAFDFHILNRFLLYWIAGLSGSQLHKPRSMLNKFDQLGLSTSAAQQTNHTNPNLLHNGSSTQNSRLQSFFPQQQQQQPPQSQPNSSVDDELDFDPFFETQKGLAELLENELLQQQSQPNHPKWLENGSRRTRMPPPGFSHMNSFGLGVPRPSKILPFMNGGGNAANQSPQANWSHHQPQQPQSNMNFGPHDQTANLMSQQNHQTNKGGKYHCYCVEKKFHVHATNYTIYMRFSFFCSIFS